MPKRPRADSKSDDYDLVAAGEADEPELVEVELKQKDFDRDDLTYLSRNEHARFMPSSKKVGHALVYHTETGAKAMQFTPPTQERIHNQELEVDLQVRPLQNIRAERDEFGSYSKEYLRAETPGGTEMVALRHLHVRVEEDDREQQDYELWRFSPVQEHIWKATGKLFIGAGPEELPIFKADLSEEDRKDLAREGKDLASKVKHHEFEISHETVLERERRSKIPRKPTQNQVMGGEECSAFKEVKSYGEERSEELHPERLAIVAKNNKAENIRSAKLFERQYRHEWGHAMAYSLTHPQVNPQIPENLAAMPMYMNTTMMIPERVAKWFGLHRLTATMKGEVHFRMIPGTEILDHGYTKYSFKEGSRQVSIYIRLNPWVKYAAFPKATDIGQTVMVTYNLITGKKPASVQAVPKKKQGGKDMLGFHVEAPEKSTAGASKDKSAVPLAMPTTKAESAEVAATTVTRSPALTIQDRSPESLRARQKAYRNSLVEVYNHSFIPLYAAPWRGNTYVDSHGSGVVIQLRNKLYILTNAHVAENHMDLRVRLANHSRQYPAKVVQIGYQCDLALLEVEAPEFAKQAVPLPFSNHMVQPHDFIEVYGFPTGGEELSFTSGTVSRIELGMYEEGGEHNLWAQTDAPVNPGNSGGPILMDGKIVGLAFQSLFLHDGIHYVIPIPVIKHFLRDVFNPGGYKGFPTIQMDLQRIEGDELRKYYGLTEDQSGVRVESIDTLSEAHGKLMPDDIITHIDGMKVSDDEKINVEGVAERLDLNYAWLRKFVGDTVNIRFLRKNPLTKKLEAKEVDIELKHRAGYTKKVGDIEYDKYPTFLISDLVVFQPLVPNMIETEDGKELITFHTDDDKYLQDVPAVKPGDQLIRITTVFKHDATFGSHEVENKFIKKVNGRSIDNMEDLVAALRCPINGQTVIELRNKTIMVMRKIPHLEHVAILRKRGINSFCSDDLMPYVKDGLDPAHPSVQHNPLSEVPATQAIDDDLFDLPPATQPFAEQESSSDEEEMDDSKSLSEADSDDESDDSDDEEELREDGKGFIADDEDILADRDVAPLSDDQRVPASSRGMAQYSSAVERIAARAAAEASAMNAARAMERDLKRKPDAAPMLNAHKPKRRLVVESDEEELAPPPPVDLQNISPPGKLTRSVAEFNP